MKKHIPLIIGISLPFLMILIIIVSIYLPRLFMNPTYSFLYTTSQYENNCNQKPVPNQYGNVTYYNECASLTYEVENGRVVAHRATTTNSLPVQKLYMYDVVRDSAREISIDEAKTFKVSSDSRSPDGYEVSYQYNNAGIFELFGGGNRNSGWVLKKGVTVKPLAASMGNPYNYYNNQIKLLGWIIK